MPESRIVAPFRPLHLIYSLLKGLDFTVLTQAESDIVDHMPLVLVQVNSIENFSNFQHTGRAAKVSVTFISLAGDDDDSFSAISKAYTTIYQRINDVTEYGWVARVDELEAPILSTNSQSADNVYQYECTLELTIRKDS